MFKTETWDENQTFLQLKYHTKVQTRSQHLVKIEKYYYKYCIKNLKSINNLKQCKITSVSQREQIELFTNWWKHLLLEYQDGKFQRPPEEIFVIFKME